MKRTLLAASIAAALAAAGAGAAERTAYKFVDEKGKVVYSQTPPVDGRDARKLDITPAQIGRQAYVPPLYPYQDPGRYAGSSGYDTRLNERQRMREAAQRERLSRLEAECVRNRGTNCGEPESLRYIESTKIPGSRLYRGPAR